MKGTTHAALGVAAAAIINGASLPAMIKSPEKALPVVAGYFGALFCDIDCTGSTISNKLSPVGLKGIGRVISAGLVLAAIGAGIYLKHPPLAIAGIYMLIMMCSPHRGYSHSLLAVIACHAFVRYICVYYGIQDISIYLAVGMLSHILADMFTEKGTAALFPYPKRLAFPVTIKTGSYVEHIIVLAAAAIAFLNI